MKRRWITYGILSIIVILITIGIYGYAEKQRQKQRYSVQEYHVQQTANMKSDTMHLSIVEFDTLNPIISKNQNVQDITKLIFEPLLELDEHDQIQLGLAKEWAKMGDLQYLIKIRDDVLWQDKEPLTTQDVEYTIQTIKENPTSIYYTNVEYIEEVAIIDNTTMRITLTKEIPFFEYQLTFPILHKMEEKSSEYIGTGRYRVKEQTEQLILLEENEEWTKREKIENTIKKVDIHLQGSISEAYQSFKEGNIDLLVTSNLEIENYIGSMGFKSKSFIDRQYDFLACNMEDTVLSKKEVREAIDYAINRQEVIDQIYQGKYEIADFPITGILEKSEEENTYQPEKAREILTQSGWKEGQIEVTLTVCAEHEKRVEVAKKIKEQVEQVGIQININLVSLQQFNKCIQTKNYELLLAGMQTSINPDLDNYLGSENITNFHNEEIQELLMKARDIEDKTILRETYKRIWKIVQEEKPYIGLYYQTKMIYYQKNLMGTIIPNSYQIFYHMESWYLTE